MRTPNLIAELTPKPMNTPELTLGLDLPPEWMEVALQLYPELTAPRERMRHLLHEVINGPDYVLSRALGLNQP